MIFFLKDVLLNSSFNMFGGFSFLFYFWGACSCNGHSDDMLQYLRYTALQTKLRSGLHGQHLVADIVPKHLKFHMMHNPSKALALSFHGGPGTGKNYVGKIIAESIFKKGMGSKYVHLISASHRYIHQDLRSVYKVLNRK